MNEIQALLFACCCDSVMLRFSAFENVTICKWVLCLNANDSRDSITVEIVIAQLIAFIAQLNRVVLLDLTVLSVLLTYLIYHVNWKKKE